MKILILTSVFLLSLQAHAGLINYQGRLVGDDGNPINASWDVEVKVFGDEASQEAVYTEVISSVPINNGLYSFSFGADGVGVRTNDETISYGDGVTKVFNLTPRKQIVAGSVTITDGTYSWNDSTGASDASNFIGSVNIPDNNVSAIYFNEAPANDVGIMVTYDYTVQSLQEVLKDYNSCFVQVQIGQYSFSKEPLSYVPFALRSEFSNNELKTKSYRPIFYMDNNTSNIQGPIGDGRWRVKVPKNVISTYSMLIKGSMAGKVYQRGTPLENSSSFKVSLQRENLFTNEIETIDLLQLETVKPINFEREVSIDKWIDSSDPYSLILIIHNSQTRRGDGWSVPGLSQNIIVTHD